MKTEALEVTQEVLDDAAPAGTVARLALEHLMSFPAGTERSSAQLAEAAGQSDSAGMGNYLRRPLAVGLIEMRRAGRLCWWRMAGTMPTRTPTFDDDDDPRTVQSVSAKAVPSIFAYAQQRGAAKFSFSLSTDGRLTFERNGRVIVEFTDSERRALIVAAAQGVAPR